jgi:2-hydroxychromene-2-carboxylate isomerase
MRDVDFYYDYASPWSYLASEIIPKKLAGARVRYVPTYIRGLESFATGIPYSGAKLAYLTKDLQRCCEHEGVAIAPPAAFPINGLHALRAALVADARGKLPAFHAAAMAAAWREQKDIGDPAVVLEVLARATGESTSALADAVADAAIKDRLKQNTARAAELGMFGVPTFVVDGELFWGHDRMDYVARAAGVTS